LEEALLFFKPIAFVERYFSWVDPSWSWWLVTSGSNFIFGVEVVANQPAQLALPMGEQTCRKASKKFLIAALQCV
jgi:hypothetical protein